MKQSSKIWGLLLTSLSLSYSAELESAVIEKTKWYQQRLQKWVELTTDEELIHALEIEMGIHNEYHWIWFNTDMKTWRRWNGKEISSMGGVDEGFEERNKL